MAKSKRSGKAHVSGYARYKTAETELVNRKNRLTKLASEQPNNEQIPLAIKNIRHRRFTPKTEHWSPTAIRVASMIKRFTGKFDKGIFSADPALFAAACRVKNENKFKNLVTENPKGSMFAIKERVRWKS